MCNAISNDPATGTTRQQDLTPLHERWVYDKLCAAVDNDNRRRCKRLGKEVAADLRRYRQPGKPKNIMSLDPGRRRFYVGMPRGWANKLKGRMAMGARRERNLKDVGGLNSNVPTHCTKWLSLTGTLWFTATTDKILVTWLQPGLQVLAKTRKRWHSISITVLLKKNALPTYEKFVRRNTIGTVLLPIVQNVGGDKFAEKQIGQWWPTRAGNNAPRVIAGHAN